MRLDFLLSFGVYAVVLGHPETSAVSHSSPKVCAALQRKWSLARSRAEIAEAPFVPDSYRTII